MAQDYLIHYGVLGMKWGVRKDRSRSGGIFRKKKRKMTSYDDDDLTTLDDAELRARINRLQMEKQYAQLTTKETSFGRKVVQEVLKEVGKEYLRTAIKSGINKSTSGALDSMRDAMINVIDPRRRF